MRYHAAVLMTRLGQFELAQKVLTEFVSEGNDNPKILEALGLSSLRIPQLPEEVDPSKREAILLAGSGTFYYYSRMTAAVERPVRGAACAGIRICRTCTTRLASCC